MSQSYTNFVYHIIFSTKYRQPLITNEIKPRLYGYIGGIIKRQGGIALAINGMADHIHILAKLRADKAVSDTVRDVKANSSGWIHKNYSEQKNFSWQNGFGGFTVSASQIEKVRNYIVNQEIHHQKSDFKNELAKLLQASGVEFDEKYL